MKYFLPLLYIFFLFSCNTETKRKRNSDLALTYNTPAKIWEETVPLGNGRLGMMPDGGVNQETIVLNDISMWSGSPEDALSETALQYLPKIRKLLLQGKNLEAQELMYQHFRCKGKGSAFGQGLNAPYGCFQMLGKMTLDYTYPNTAKAENYERGLNLSTAQAYTTFTKDKTQFSRTYFASQKDDILLIRIKANNKKAVNFKLQLHREERAKIFTKDGDLYMKGQLNDGHNGKNGVQFYTRIHIKQKGGTQKAVNKALEVQNADEVVICISSGTDFFFQNMENTVDSLLENASKKPFAELEKQHIAEYQEKFNRVCLDLGKEDTITAQLSTPEKLQQFQQKPNPSLVALYFQYGRYLMISGTRKGSLPLNLQGLWANTLQTPWNGDYHLNINVQMNYWQAEVCNLSEYHEPLLKFTKDLVPSGQKTAKAYYGSNGWVAHVISNPWQFTAPGEHASWGATNTGGAWLCSHLWEHYAYTQNKEYLASVFPTMQGAATFFLETMIKEPKNNWLVTAPSSSPENGFYLPNKTQITYVCLAPTMDAQIIRQLFQNTEKAAQILGIKNAVITKIHETLPLLPPTQISKNGYIQEWLEDYKEMDVHHRHVSHLYGLFPATQISPSKTPKLAEAAKITLNRRGDEGTGWSRAWKINFWARLYDGNRAYKLLKSLLKPSFSTSYDYLRKGGTYPNLFCAHPPFQIDGNFGGTSGVAEMLIQSHEGYINILPAIPTHWKKGSFKGLKVRGGGEVSAKWEHGKIKSIKLVATVANDFKILLPKNTDTFLVNGKNTQKKSNFFTTSLKKGEEITLEF